MRIIAKKRQPKNWQCPFKGKGKGSWMKKLLTANAQSQIMALQWGWERGYNEVKVRD